MNRTHVIWLSVISIGFFVSCASSWNQAKGATDSAVPTLINTAVMPTEIPIPAPEPTSPPAPLPTDTPAPDDAMLIQQTFEHYRFALIQGDAEAAVEAVDRQTIAWYDQVLEFALVLDRTELNRLKIIEKFTVLRLRHEFSKEELEGLTGREVFKEAVNRGWIGRSTVENMELGTI